MRKSMVVRSTLKFVGVAVLVGAAWSAEARASQSSNWCEEKAVECAQMCGTTVSWGNYWSYWDSCFDWNPVDGCIGGLSGIGGVIFSSGIDDFECWDWPRGDAYCVCAY